MSMKGRVPPPRQGGLYDIPANPKGDEGIGIFPLDQPPLDPTLLSIGLNKGMNAGQVRRLLDARDKKAREEAEKFEIEALEKKMGALMPIRSLVIRASGQGVHRRYVVHVNGTLLTNHAQGECWKALYEVARKKKLVASSQFGKAVCRYFRSDKCPLYSSEKYRITTILTYRKKLLEAKEGVILKTS